MFWKRLGCLLLALVLTPALPACPLCKEAVSSPGMEDEYDPARSASAYNSNILGMLLVMYVSLFVAGFFIYRGVQKNAEYLAKVQTPASPPVA